jgi:hypothetical protein
MPDVAVGRRHVHAGRREKPHEKHDEEQDEKRMNPG